LGCKPQSADGNGENDRDLTDEEIWLRHARPPDESGVANSKRIVTLFLTLSSPIIKLFATLHELGWCSEMRMRHLFACLKGEYGQLCLIEPG
jgi:hypothetical protein